VDISVVYRVLENTMTGKEFDLMERENCGPKPRMTVLTKASSSSCKILAL
jgi:hypothetical protein